jgi:hypothetical protein
VRRYRMREKETAVSQLLCEDGVKTTAVRCNRASGLVIDGREGEVTTVPSEAVVSTGDPDTLASDESERGESTADAGGCTWLWMRVPSRVAEAIRYVATRGVIGLPAPAR